jgi:hypothetical protein
MMYNGLEFRKSDNYSFAAKPTRAAAFGEWE